MSLPGGDAPMTKEPFVKSGIAENSVAAVDDGSKDAWFPNPFMPRMMTCADLANDPPEFPDTVEELVAI